MGVEEGLMYQHYFPWASSQLATLSGSVFLRGIYVFLFPAYGKNQSAIRIQKPGIYFLGSFRYKEVKTGLLEAGKFDIERAGVPTEAELLERIRKMKWV